MSRHFFSFLGSVWHPRTVASFGLTLLLSSSLWVNPLKAADPPLLPFNNPGDLLLLDHGCGCILRVSPERVVSVHLTSAQIGSAAQVGEVCFEAGGLAFDAEGALYFVEGENQILKQFSDGRLIRLARRDFFLSLQGVGAVLLANIVVGSDGFLYVTDSQNASLIRVDRETGSVALVATRSELFDALGSGVNLGEGLVADERGTLIVFSHDPPSMFSVDTVENQIQLLASGSSLMRPDGFATRAPNRDLVVGNQPGGIGVHSLYTVTRAGQPSVFLSGEAIAEAVLGLAATDVNLEGGIAFDNQGNLFFAESESDNIMKFDCQTGEVSIWVTPAELKEAVGALSQTVTLGDEVEDPDLRAGIAFASRGQIPGPFLPSIPGDPETRHARVDTRPRDGAPDTGDDTLVMSREENVVGGFSSDRLDSQLQCRMSNRHPLTGHFQTCSTRTPLREPLANALDSLGSNSLVKWGKKILFQVLGDRSIENTVTIDSYDSNLRPTSWRAEHRLGPMSIESQIHTQDENDDGLTDALAIQTIVPLASATIELQLVDSNNDGIDDYVGFPITRMGWRFSSPWWTPTEPAFLIRQSWT